MAAQREGKRMGKSRRTEAEQGGRTRAKRQGKGGKREGERGGIVHYDTPSHIKGTVSKCQPYSSVCFAATSPSLGEELDYQAF